MKISFSFFAVLIAFILLTVPAVAKIDLSKPLPVVALKSGKVLKNVTIISFASNVLTAKWDGGRGTISYHDLPNEIRSEVYSRRVQPEPPSESTPAIWTERDEVQNVMAAAPTLSGPKIDLGHEKSLLGKSITGQVFVTTKGGQSIKLGGVSVAIYPSAGFEEFQRWLRGPGQERADYFATVAEKYSKGNNNATAAMYYKFAIAARRDAWAFLPATPYVTMTDADGRYKLEHPISGNFVVFAKAKREIGDETEYYTWVIKSSEIPVSGELLLHNANMN